MNPREALLTAAELAARLRKSRDWVYRRARMGQIPGALRLEGRWRFRKAAIDRWLFALEDPTGAPARGVGDSLSERRAALMKVKRDMKITVRQRTQGYGGLEVDLFWTDADGKRHRMRRASPYKSKNKTRRWAQQLLRERMGTAGGPVEEEEHEPTPYDTQHSYDHDKDTEEEGLTFSEFVPRFLALCESPAAGRRGANSEGELANKRGMIRDHLEPYFGQMLLSEITAREADAYVCAKSTTISKRTSKPLSSSSIANHLGLLRRMLKVACRWDMLTKVPEITIPKKGEVDNYLSRRESRRLLAKADPLFRDMIALGLRTGMRLGELQELRVGDINLGAARIRVTRQRTKEGTIKKPKGDKTRTVQVPHDAVTMLRKRVAGLERDELVFSKPAGYQAPHRTEAPAEGGEHWSHKEVFAAVQRATEAAKIGRKVGVHTLRHTFATHAVAAGVPLSVVSRQLGHADIRTTMRYAHHAPELNPGIFDRLADGSAIPAGCLEGGADDQSVDDSSTGHPVKNPEARER